MSVCFVVCATPAYITILVSRDISHKEEPVFFNIDVVSNCVPSITQIPENALKVVADVRLAIRLDNYATTVKQVRGSRPLTKVPIPWQKLFSS